VHDKPDKQVAENLSKLTKGSKSISISVNLLPNGQNKALAHKNWLLNTFENIDKNTNELVQTLYDELTELKLYQAQKRYLCSYCCERKLQ
jgi:hypothetical protein